MRGLISASGRKSEPPASLTQVISGLSMNCSRQGRKTPLSIVPDEAINLYRMSQMFQSGEDREQPANYMSSHKRVGPAEVHRRPIHLIQNS